MKLITRCLKVVSIVLIFHSCRKDHGNGQLQLTAGEQSFFNLVSITDMLQFTRGYVPFETIVHVQKRISGTLYNTAKC
jgi:hypothetical protein